LDQIPLFGVGNQFNLQRLQFIVSRKRLNLLGENGGFDKLDSVTQAPITL
jgi:hypothetical protein